MLRIALALAATSMLAAPVMAAPCRDAKGHFIKCPPKPAPKATGKCRDAKGRFAKCGSAGARPA